MYVIGKITKVIEFAINTIAKRIIGCISVSETILPRSGHEC